jgi:hypothetical protein
MGRSYEVLKFVNNAKKVEVADRILRLEADNERIGEIEEENARLKSQIEALKDYARALELCLGESQLCEYCPFNGIDFNHDDINCTIDFDGLRRKAGMDS